MHLWVFFKNSKFASDFSDDMKVPHEKISIYFSPFLSHFPLKERLWMVKKVKVKDMRCTYGWDCFFGGTVQIRPYFRNI